MEWRNLTAESEQGTDVEEKTWMMFDQKAWKRGERVVLREMR